MTPEKLVAEIRTSVVVRNAAIYKSLFESTDPDRAQDPYWKRALHLYNSLDEPDRATLLEMMNQATVDAVSGLFGILDGSSPIGEQRVDFILRTTTDPRNLNGNLQDLLLG